MGTAHPTKESNFINNFQAANAKVEFQLNKEFFLSLLSAEKGSFTIAEVFPEYVGREKQAALRAYRHREGLTQKQLAELSGIPQHHISEIENGKRMVGKERAKRLAQALNCDYRQLL